MSTLIILIHVVVCIALIFVVLLQTGKGADMGAAFGGGSSQTIFGSTGASSFLSKMTTGAAVVFMLTSLTLAYFSSRRPTSSLMPAAAPAPVTQQTQGEPAESQVPAPVQSEATLPESAAEPAPTGPVSKPAPKPAPELPEKG